MVPGRMITASLIPLPTDPEVAARVDALELPFNRHGIDHYGIDKRELAKLYTLIGWFYHRYFEVQVFGADNVPPRGRAMLVGNHSGGVALDGVMVIASTFFELNPPRLAQGMVEKFLSKVPFLSWFNRRIGQFTGLPEHCIRLLEDERLLMVFPEGARGTAKLYRERDSLVSFGTGFVRLALQTDTQLTLRVPSKRFRAVMRGVAGLGEVTTRSVNTVDVSEEFHDLKIELDNLEATRARIQKLLDQAKGLDEILRVEKELQRISAQIDTLEGRMRFLGSRAAFSTITVTVSERAPVVLAEPDVEEVEPPPPPPPPPPRLLDTSVDWIDEVGVDRLMRLP